MTAPKRRKPVTRNRTPAMRMAFLANQTNQQLNENKLEAKKRELLDQARNTKLQVGSQFEDIRQRIDQREREIMQKIDNLNLKGQSELENCIRLVKTRKQNLRDH